ncbi:MAG TPA: signal peptidase II [Actinomycetota bacterium]|jgi:signal peptidase II
MERAAGGAARRGAAILFLTAAAVFLLDRVTKLWAQDVLATSGPIEVIPGFLRLRYTTNPGGAFSILGSAPWFFAAATLGVSLVIVIVSFRRRPPVQSVALGLILGGALGNLTDRAIRGPGLSGEVVDFVDLHLGSAFSWPVFNVADSAIVVGALLLAFSSAWSARQPPADGGEPPTGDPGVAE